MLKQGFIEQVYCFVADQVFKINCVEMKLSSESIKLTEVQM